MITTEMKYRVVIPTAGIGGRLGKFTKNLNKSLLSINYRPIISYIIEQFPADVEFVIALGYKGNLVREFLQLAYPEKKFYFVNVRPYIGKGSGLGLTLLKCEKYLKQPFVFSSCDTLVKGPIPKPNYDWMGYSKKKNLLFYRSVSLKNNFIKKIHEKGDKTFYNQRPYIGLAGINDHKTFWTEMKKNIKKSVIQGEAFGFKAILSVKKVKGIYFDWNDTGNLENLKKTRKLFPIVNQPNVLEKENESIWFVNNKVIKFSKDLKFIKNRSNRSKKIKNFVPEIIGTKKYMYSYNMVEGKVFSKVVNIQLFKKLLIFSKKFWKEKKLNKPDIIRFKKNCTLFYKNKTEERVKLFYKKFDKIDGEESINNLSMPKLSVLLKKINWKKLSEGKPGRYHGDYHFENILWQTKNNNFIFLDWRQDFNGDLEVGDIYYDVAKLLHGLIVEHDSIQKNLFTVKWTNKEIYFDIKRKKILINCEKQLNRWCENNNISFKKVKLLTSLIYLNIAALHHYPYCLFLYSIGKYMLRKELILNETNTTK